MKGNTPPIRLCHICGWLIPYGIVKESHPLFGTIDHVVPRSKGGGNGHNLQPAHWLCNKIKNDRDMDVTVSVEAAKAIMPYIVLSPEVNTRRGRNALRSVRRLIADGERLKQAV